MATGPGVSDRSHSKLNTQQRAPGKRQTPPPRDKHSECVQGQALYLDHTTKNRRLAHVPNLEKISQTIEHRDAFYPEQYCAHLDKVAIKFYWCLMEDICLKPILAH